MDAHGVGAYSRGARQSRRPAPIRCVAMATEERTDTMVCYRHPSQETAVACSACGRPICPDCMVFTAVGIKCPECAGRLSRRAEDRQADRQRGRPRHRRDRHEGADRAERGDLPRPDRPGERHSRASAGRSSRTASCSARWSRTASGGGSSRPASCTRARSTSSSTCSCSGGSAPRSRRSSAAAASSRSTSSRSSPALPARSSSRPTAAVVGASGAVFGILGAGLVLERNRIQVFGGSALLVVGFNLVLSFVLSNVSLGGHLGGLVGGIAAILVLTQFGRRHAVYGRADALTIAGLVGIAVISVAIAYARVRGYA